MKLLNLALLAAGGYVAYRLYEAHVTPATSEVDDGSSISPSQVDTSSSSPDSGGGGGGGPSTSTSNQPPSGSQPPAIVDPGYPGQDVGRGPIVAPAITRPFLPGFVKPFIASPTVRRPATSYLPKVTPKITPSMGRIINTPRGPQQLISSPASFNKTIVQHKIVMPQKVKQAGSQVKAQKTQASKQVKAAQQQSMFGLSDYIIIK